MRLLVFLSFLIPCIALSVPPDGIFHYVIPHRDDPKILQFQATQNDLVGKPPVKGNFIACNFMLANKGDVPGTKTHVSFSIQGYRGHGDPDFYYFSMEYPKTFQLYQEKTYNNDPVAINMLIETKAKHTPIVEVICKQYRR